jgi:hypothetical protein
MVEITFENQGDIGLILKGGRHFGWVADDPFPAAFKALALFRMGNVVDGLMSAILNAIS